MTNNIKVSQLPVVSSTQETDTHMVVQGGVSKKITTNQLLSTTVRPIATVAALRSTMWPYNDQQFQLAGHTAAGDGGGGTFRVVSGAVAGTYVDNNGTIIVPTGGDGSLAYLRVYSGEVNVRWFGLDTVSVLAAVTEAGVGGAVYFPQGVYDITDHDADGIALTQLSGQTWRGDGEGSILRLSPLTTTLNVMISVTDFAENYTLKDLQIDGNRSNITPSTDLYNTFYLVRGPRGGKNGKYENLLLSNSWGRSLQTSNESVTEYAENITVNNVRVLNGGTKGISATQSKRVTITDSFSEINPYTSADHVWVIGDGNASSGSCFEVNDSHNVTISGNHGIQVGAVVVGPGIRLINESYSIRAFGNIIEDASYLGFIQNVNDIEFFSNTGTGIRGNGILIADADGEAGTCKRVKVHHNTIIDPSGAYVLVTGTNSAGVALETRIYDNDFIQVSGSPTHGISNTGVIAPATGGTCDVYAWGNNFTGSIPNQYGGSAAAEIQSQPDGGWLVVAQSSVAVAHTGDTSETTLASVIIPKNRMGKNGRVRITAHFSYTNSVNNKITRLRFGGLLANSATNTTTAQQRIQIEVGNRNSLSSQVASISGAVGGYGQTTGATTVLAVDTSADISVALTGQLSDLAETVTLESYSVEIFYQL